MDFDEKCCKRYDYIIYCNDIIVSILKYADNKKLNNINIHMNEPDLKKFNEVLKMKDNQIWQDWLLNNGYFDEMTVNYYKHTLFSLLKEFWYFMNHSSVAISKNHISVAYALLRKPLRDILYYIEWLAIDKNELVQYILSGDLKKLEFDRNKAKNNIELVIKKYSLNDNKIDEIKRLRYDKDYDRSLEKIWNKANHIITTYSYTRTEKGNLNFIFNTYEYDNYLVKEYFRIVPFLLNYVIELLFCMLKDITPLYKYTIMINDMNRLIKYADIVDSSEKISNFFEYNKIPLICPNCNNKIPIYNDNYNLLLNDFCICCKCKYKLNTSRYIFDYQYLYKRKK